MDSCELPSSCPVERSWFLRVLGFVDAGVVL